MKARIKATGEIVDVFDYRYGSKISSENFVVYTDSNGHAHFEKGVDFSEDFEEVSDDEAQQADKWEQRRYEIAKEVFTKMLFAPQENHSLTAEADAETSVELADILIAELKKGGTL